MWRDLNIFNEVGIPAVTFGPPRRTPGGGPWRGGDDRFFTKDDLLEAARIYALTALAICNTPGGGGGQAPSQAVSKPAGGRA